QLGGGLHEFTVLQADDADRALVVERVAVVGVEGAVVLAPQVGALLVGDPEAAFRVIGERRTCLEPSRFGDVPPDTLVIAAFMYCDIIITCTIGVVSLGKFPAWACRNRLSPAANWRDPRRRPTRIIGFWRDLVY